MMHITENEPGFIGKTMKMREGITLDTGERFIVKTTMMTYNVTGKLTITFKREMYNYPTRNRYTNKRLSCVELTITNHETGEFYLTGSHSMITAIKLALCLIPQDE